MKPGRHMLKLTYLALGFVSVVLCIPAQTQEAVQQLEPVSEYWDYMPDWSPDGSNIVFVSTRATHPARSLFVVDLKSGNIRALTHTKVAGGDNTPRWSPDGKWIAFTSNREGNADVYVIRADGTGLRNLTQSPDKKGEVVDWSPDGKRIIFSSNRDGDPNLYTMSSDGSDIRKLTDISGDVVAPDWSPDGSRIAFAWNRDGNWELYTIAADGTDLQRLTYHWAWDGHPAWSPDGKQLVFWSDRDDFWFEIYLMNADGSDVRRLTHSPDWDLNPDWSPDGKQIAWHSRSGAGRYGIEVMKVDGTGRGRLTSAEPSNFAHLVRQAGVEAALAAHRKAKQHQPDASFFYSGEIWLLADERIAKGDIPGAIRLNEFHVDIVSGTVYYAYEALGRAYRAAGRSGPPRFAEFFELIRTQGVGQARAVFDQTQRQFPAWKFFSEFRMNRLGYEYLNRGWVKEAIVLFEMNVATYPQSPNVYDSLAEAYMVGGNKELAIENYRKSLELNPQNRNAIDMLKKLLGR